MNVLRWCCVALLSGFSLTGSSQEVKKLLGSVKNAEGAPVAGANVYVDGVNTYQKTNARGYFEVEVDSATQVISVYAEAYGLMSGVYNHQPRLNFVFLEGNSPQEENTSNEMAIGYATVDKKDAVYATSKIDTKEVGPVGDAAFTIYDLISTRVPGVRVTTNNEIIVRGVSNFRGPATPLIVVNDQIVTSVDWVVPSEVKSVEFLKDAATSIYGSQGANGVLIIKLKQ